jgi:TPR repeat protein
MPKLISYLIAIVVLVYSNQIACSQTDLEQAIQALEQKDYKHAVQILSHISDGGDPVAKYKLAELYYGGLGVPGDPKKAAALYEAAASANIMNAQQNIGVMYLNGDGVDKDPTKAFYWFQKAAMQGDPFAEVSLGLRYIDGQGTEKNGELALQWLRKAADQDNANAFYIIGQLYSDGKLVKSDAQLSTNWMLRAANRGIPNAQYIIGFDFLKGKTVRKDLTEAYKWLVLCEKMSRRPIDLTNEDWEPNAGSIAISVNEQFKSFMRKQDLEIGQAKVQKWLSENGQ